MLSVLTVWDTPRLPRSTHYSSAQILFPWSHTGWNTLWWSYLTSPGWPTCEGVWKMTLRPQSIRSYRVFVDVLAVRENERGFSTAQRTAGDQWAPVQLISGPYVVHIGAVESPCHPCGRTGKAWKVWEGHKLCYMYNLSNPYLWWQVNYRNKSYFQQQEKRKSKIQRREGSLCVGRLSHF